MDPVFSEMLARLEATVTGLFAALPINPRPDVRVLPRRLGRVGIGNYVGSNRTPPGDIVGRRIDASVRVTAHGAGVPALNTAIRTITQALVGVDASLRAKGFLRVNLETVSEVIKGQGNDMTQGLDFSILFEFVKTPVESGDTIRAIPLTIRSGAP